MSWFKFGKAKPQQQVAEASDAPCLHAALVPHWDRAEDIGHDDRATSFLCDSCGTSFTPEERQGIRDKEAQRLREMLGP
jgi:hypothetical protein